MTPTSIRSSPGSDSEEDVRAMSLKIGSLAALMALTLAGCTAAEPDETANDGLGVMAFSLPGIFPGVKFMMVRVYQGPIVDLGEGLKYELPCIPYTGTNTAGEETSKNAFTLDRLPVRDDYAVLIDLFADEACTELRIRAYRSGLAVQDKSEAEVARHPYYIQPYILDSFTGMATPSAELQQKVAKKACAVDADCKTLQWCDGTDDCRTLTMPTATCSTTKTCTVDTLFPLNGGARRGLPTVVGLSSGEVAISGGVSVHDGKGGWTATNEAVEVFDPAKGIFEHPARQVDNLGKEARVSLASSLPLGGRTFALVGGIAKLRLSLAGGKLTTDISDDTCGGAGADCPASKAVWRVDLAQNGASGTKLDGFLALPVVAHVASKEGPRVLVAGGAGLPLPKSGDGRSAEAFLCELAAGKASCISSSSFMKAARAGAATACIEAGASACKKLLILGGRKSSSSPLAEVYDASTDTFAEVNLAGGAPSIAHGGTLVPNGDGALLLLGASKKPLFIDAPAAGNGGDLPAMRIVIEAGDPANLTFSEVKMAGQAKAGSDRRALATGVGLADGTALLIGGLSAANKVVKSALWIDDAGSVKAEIPLDVARFGAGAARMDVKGPLNGCVMLAGGLTMGSEGGFEAVNHVEVFCPKAP